MLHRCSRPVGLIDEASTFFITFVNIFITDVNLFITFVNFFHNLCQPFYNLCQPFLKHMPTFFKAYANLVQTCNGGQSSIKCNWCQASVTKLLLFIGPRLDHCNLLSVAQSLFCCQLFQSWDMPSSVPVTSITIIYRLILTQYHQVPTIAVQLSSFITS